MVTRILPESITRFTHHPVLTRLLRFFTLLFKQDGAGYWISTWILTSLNGGNKNGHGPNQNQNNNNRPYNNNISHQASNAQGGNNTQHNGQNNNRANGGNNNGIIYVMNRNEADTNANVVRYIRPYEILERIGGVAYKLALAIELAHVHNVFHVSQLLKYVHDPTHIIEPETIELDETFSFEQRPVRIFDTKTKSNWNKAVKLVKVLWSSQTSEGATWEAKDDMKNRYPELFQQVEFRGRNTLRGVECDTNFLFAY